MKVDTGTWLPWDLEVVVEEEAVEEEAVVVEVEEVVVAVAEAVGMRGVHPSLTLRTLHSF